MKNIWKRFTEKYFGEHLEYRAKVFYAMMFIAFVTYAIGAAIGIYAARGESFAGFPALICALFALWLTRHANKTKKYQRCYLMMTIIIYMGQASLAFFLNGGNRNGGLFTIFMTNVAVTAFLFEGKKAIVVPLILVTHYAAIIIYAHYNPDSVKYFGEYEQFFSSTSVFVVNCLTLAVIITLHLRLHDRQKRELDTARQFAVELEKLKSDFFTEMSHEYKTPLSVINLNAQMINRHISSNNISEQTRAYLNAISHEAKRLASITNLALTTLRTPFELGGAGAETSKEKFSAESIKDLLSDKYVFAPILLGDLVKIVAGVAKPIIMQNGFTLITEYNNKSPQISGDNDTLIRLLINLLHNAVVHSGGKTIIVCAFEKDGRAVLTVEDDGAGVAPHLIDKVFDRGVSGANSTGLGLYICKNIVLAHKGDIRMENKIGGGAVITVTFPMVKEV